MKHFFIHIPKTSGTTIYNILGEEYKNKYYDSMTLKKYEEKNHIKLNKVDKFKKYYQEKISIDHIKIDDLLELNIISLEELKSKQVFVIIRDPITRFLSMCNSLKKKPKDLILEIKHLYELNEQNQCKYDDYNHRKNWVSTQKSYLTNKHNIKINYFLYEEVDKIDKYCTENFNKKYINNKKNVSPKICDKNSLDNNDLEFINNFYKEDFELYKSLKYIYNNNLVPINTN